MAHCNTILHQLLSLVPRRKFEVLAEKHGTGRRDRGFSRWSQFVSLAFIHLASRKSMRDGIRNLDANSRSLYHLGIKPVARSTFADANAKRPAAFYEALFAKLYQLCSTVAPGHKFRFKAKLFSLDASTVKLCLSAFPWASFRAKRGGIKLHTLLDHDGYIPAFLSVTNARKHEAKVAKSIELPEGSIVVFDKGYNDYAWFRTLSLKGISFVTRLKRNASYKIIDRRPVSKAQGLTSDQIILVSTKGKELKLRRVGYRDAQTGKHYVFLTNNLTLSPKTIADIYRERWQIETFFRLIKQNLKIKSFVGNSENAVMSQVYVAMIVYLLLAYLKFRSKLGLSIQKMVQLLQLHLFRRRDLVGLLEPPRIQNHINNDYSLLSCVG